MADFGFWELALILFVALLVIGPDRLPAVAVTLGRWFGRMRGLANQFKADFMRETRTDDLKKIMDDAHDTIGAVQQRINRDLRNTDPLARSIEKQIESGRFTQDSVRDVAQENGDAPPASRDEHPDATDVRPDDRPLGKD